MRRHEPDKVFFSGERYPAKKIALMQVLLFQVTSYLRQFPGPDMDAMADSLPFEMAAVRRTWQKTGRSFNDFTYLFQRLLKVSHHPAQISVFNAQGLAPFQHLNVQEGLLDCAVA